MARKLPVPREATDISPKVKAGAVGAAVTALIIAVVAGATLGIAVAAGGLVSAVLAYIKTDAVSVE